MYTFIQVAYCTLSRVLRYFHFTPHFTRFQKEILYFKQHNILFCSCLLIANYKPLNVFADEMISL